MDATHVSPEQARAMIATADTLEGAVRAGASWHFVGWLAGMATATLMYLAALGVARDDASVLLVSLPFGVAVAVLSVGFLGSARVSKAGFDRRWSVTLLAWAALFAAALVIGLTQFRADPVFWLPAAFVAAAPLAIGARTEARA